MFNIKYGLCKIVMPIRNFIHNGDEMGWSEACGVRVVCSHIFDLTNDNEWRRGGVGLLCGKGARNYDILSGRVYQRTCKKNLTFTKIKARVFIPADPLPCPFPFPQYMSISGRKWDEVGELIHILNRLHIRRIHIKYTHILPFPYYFPVYQYHTSFF
jgi:hypothetical protein